MEKGRKGQKQTQIFTKKHFMFLAAAKNFLDVDDLTKIFKIISLINLFKLTP